MPPKRRRKTCKLCCGTFNRWTVFKVLNEYDLQYMSSSVRSKVKVGDKVCMECHRTGHLPLPETPLKEKQMNAGPTETSENRPDSVKCKKIKLDIPAISSSSNKCIVCGNARRESQRCFKKLSPTDRAKIFINTGIIVCEGARVCSRHFNDDGLSRDCYIQIKSSGLFNYTCEEIQSLLNEIRDIALQGSCCLNFDDVTTMTDTDYFNLTGLNKTEFNSVASHMSSLRSTSTRSSRTALALLLVKLRTGMSLSVISTIFGIKKKHCSKAIHAARKAMMSSFVPNHMGLSHIDRTAVITDHTTVFAKVLFAESKPNVAIAVADGTYIYIEKSSNYTFQKRSYSMHKGRPLVKPMMLVATDGYILNIFGPYLADGKNSDAKITEHMLNTNTENIKEWFAEGDILVVDRGFRDATDILNDIGIQTEMPSFLKKSEKQHSTEEANESRLVTKVRWVVESANGRIKTWKALRNVVPNSQIPFIGDYVRIVAALCNAFRPALLTTSDADEIIAKRMMAQAKSPNKLQKKVTTSNWDKKRVIWKNIEEAELDDFPQLTEEELRDLTMGVYQLKQAQSYTEEHFDDKGQYMILVHKEEENILKVQIKSRHRSSKLYNLWLEYGQALSPVTGWYCQCRCGARTVGCCAHVASVLWYLGYQRFQNAKSKCRPSGEFLKTVHDAAIDTWSSSGDSDED